MSLFTPSAIRIVESPTAPNDLCFSIDVLKRNCGFATAETDFDDLFRDLILMAQDHVEDAARTFLRPVVVAEEFAGFPSTNVELRLGREPVREVISVVYRNADDEDATMNVADYHAWVSHNPPLVRSRGGAAWPSTLYGYLPAVTVTYAAGPETVATNTRHALVNAVKLIATATWQNQDGREKSGGLVIPDAVHSLLMAGARRGYA